MIKIKSQKRSGTNDCIDQLNRYLVAAFRLRNIRVNNPGALPPQKVYVIEEASEFIKETTKFDRRKGSAEQMREECIDLVTTAFNYLLQDGVNLYTIFEQMADKTQRAVDRFNENGEV